MQGHLATVGFPPGPEDQRRHGLLCRSLNEDVERRTVSSSDPRPQRKHTPEDQQVVRTAAHSDMEGKELDGLRASALAPERLSGRIKLRGLVAHARPPPWACASKVNPSPLTQWAPDVIWATTEITSTSPGRPANVQQSLEAGAALVQGQDHRDVAHVVGADKLGCPSGRP